MLQGYKISTQKSVAFLYINSKLSEIKKTIFSYNCIKKNKIPRNKSNPGGKRFVF